MRLSASCTPLFERLSFFNKALKWLIEVYSKSSENHPKVALVQPSISPDLDATTRNTGSLPLGCMYLASALQKELGADCRILDTRLSHPSAHQVSDWISLDKPDIIGISTTTPTAPHMHAISSECKARFPDIPVIVGGPHASADMDDVLSDPNVDILVFGEGEITLVDLVRALSRGESLDDIPGTAHRNLGEVKINPPRPYIDDLDSIHFPAWDLIDYEASLSKLGRISVLSKSSRHMPVFTTRACPFKCIYCHNIFGKKLRSRSPENVLSELHTLYRDYGVREFEIMDDCCNLGPHFEEFLRAFRDSSMEDAVLSFPNGLRTDLLDERTLLLMKEARTYRLSIAVETASPRLQKLIKKNLNLDKIAEVARIASDLGIILHGFFMLGFPSETLEEMDQTVSFALDMNIDYAYFLAVNPFKGTEISNIAHDMGCCVNTEPSGYGFFRTAHNLSNVPNDVLGKLIRDANRRFYLSFRRLFRFIRIFVRYPRPSFSLFRNFFEMIFRTNR